MSSQPSNRKKGSLQKLTRRQSISQSLHLPISEESPQNLYSKEELEEYRAVFAMFDTDGSGAIGNEELGDAMRQMGMNPTEKELEDLVKEVDVDGNGEIDFDEFCVVLKKLTGKKETEDEVIKKCFEVFDQDGNGIVSDQEFRRVFRDIGGFRTREIEQIFQETDIDGDGQIDYEEFSQMVRTYLFDDHSSETHSQVAVGAELSPHAKSTSDNEHHSPLHHEHQ